MEKVRYGLNKDFFLLCSVSISAGCVVLSALLLKRHRRREKTDMFDNMQVDKRYKKHTASLFSLKQGSGVPIPIENATYMK